MRMKGVGVLVCWCGTVCVLVDIYKMTKKERLVVENDQENLILDRDCLMETEWPISRVTTFGTM